VSPNAFSAVVVACFVLLSTSGCDTDHCKKSPECTETGKCTTTKEGGCTAASNEDCKLGDACKKTGMCTAKDGACTAASDEDCKGSENCKSAGLCQMHGGACVDLAKDFHPACADTCRKNGRCVQQTGANCVALSVHHCLRSTEDTPEEESACRQFGKCTVKGGECVAASAADCKKSLPCKTDLQCEAVDGNCVATDAVCKESNLCKGLGRCTAKDGLCQAVSPQDCKSASQCKDAGLCTVKDGKCVAGSAGDCSQSMICQKFKRCALRGDKCDK
jgi:hypothetical protein